MLRNRMLSAFSSMLLLLAGTASAEQRYFELTDTVTRSEDPSIATVDATIRLIFNYDDATVGDYFGDTRALYDLDPVLVGQVDGNTLVSDRVLVTLYDYPDTP
jgi:hypothetical protein